MHARRGCCAVCARCRGAVYVCVFCVCLCVCVWELSRAVSHASRTVWAPTEHAEALTDSHERIRLGRLRDRILAV